VLQKNTMKLDYNRILLVHALGYDPGKAGRDISRMANIIAPMGLLSIAAYLEKSGIKTDIIDCYAHPDSEGKIPDYLKEKSPAYIGLTCTTSTFNDSVRIAKMAKEILPGIRSVFGGPHVSALREKILECYTDVDFSVIGEGEQCVEALIRAGNDKKALSEIPGLVYRDNGDISFTGFREKGIELDSLPFPAYEKLQGYPRAYKLPIFNYPRTPNTSCNSSRGCPYSCSYCDRSVFRRSFRYNSAQYLYEHVKYLKERFGIRHINFYDDQFTFNRKRVEEFCRMMLDNHLSMTFNCAVRAEHVDFELMKLMKSAGCWMMSLGIETGDPELLAQHRQNADLDMLADTIRNIKRAGIRTKGLLMMGLPGESVESIKRSMDYVFSLPIDDFNLAKFTPFPGSPLYENIHELGTFDEDWEKMDCMNFLFVPNGMTKERLEELFVEFYKAHYKRPKVMMGYVEMLWKSPDSWLRFASNLPSFLKFAKSNKRIR
jgi:anaerobic magnesium-protoporphyrin IX monomethyl ester cyclase